MSETQGTTSGGTATPTVPPPPPRLTGNTAGDLQVLAGWLWDFYRSAILQGFFLNVQNQGQAGGGDDPPPNLPDPAATNLAQAQQTANDAYLLAQAAATDANRIDGWFTGSLTISGGTTTATHTFTDAQKPPSVNYIVLAAAQTFSGTPTIASFPVIRITKNAADFVLEINSAPGSGNSVTFDFLFVRNI